jgi:hypothetical protein
MVKHRPEGFSMPLTQIFANYSTFKVDKVVHPKLDDPVCPFMTRPHLDLLLQFLHLYIVDIYRRHINGIELLTQPIKI